MLQRSLIIKCDLGRVEIDISDEPESLCLWLVRNLEVNIRMGGDGSTRISCLRLENLRTPGPRETSVACRSLDALEKLPDNIDEATKSQWDQQ